MTERTNSKLSFDAQIHGVDLKLKSNKPEQNLNKKQDDLVDRLIAKTQAKIAEQENG